MLKKEARLRRALRTRALIKSLGAVRLSVHRSSQHIYAQVLAAGGGQVLCAASTLEKALRAELQQTGNIQAASLVGKTIAERAKAQGITRVAFDRSGFQYHGRIKAVADAAREHGLEF